MFGASGLAWETSGAEDVTAECPTFAGAILMAGHAVQGEVLPIQEQSLIGTDADLAYAKRLFDDIARYVYDFSG
jgi:hypothetical protein